MTEFDDMERKSSYQVDERTFQDELELEKLAEGVVRANRLQRAFEERLKARTKAREEEAEMKAEAARLAYEQAVKSLEDVRRYNAFLELKSKHPGFSYDSYSLDHEGILLESEVLGTSDEAYESSSKVTLARLRKSSLIPRFQGRTGKDETNPG